MANSAKTWGLVGYGTIGKELARQLAQASVAKRLELEPQPAFVIRSGGVMKADGVTPSGFRTLEDLDRLPDVVFVALPSSPDGALAYKVISHVLEQDKMIVTAEKGALANHFSELRSLSDNFSRLGVSATVGGGTRLLSIAQEYCQDPENISQLHLSLNGTLTALMSSIAPPGGSGSSLGYAAYEATQLGFAEPGAESSYDVIRSEAEGDIPKKTTIFFNMLGLSNKPLDWHALQFSLKDQEISRVVEEAGVRRFIVSLYPSRKSENRPETDIVGGFSAKHDDWHIVGGFRNIERNPLFSSLGRLTGPGNGLVVGLGPNETDGVYSLTGPGAGPRPTVNTMLDDYLRLAGQRR